MNMGTWVRAAILVALVIGHGMDVRADVPRLKGNPSVSAKRSCVSVFMEWARWYFRGDAYLAYRTRAKLAKNSENLDGTAQRRRYQELLHLQAKVQDRALSDSYLRELLLPLDGALASQDHVDILLNELNRIDQLELYTRPIRSVHLRPITDVLRDLAYVQNPLEVERIVPAIVKSLRTFSRLDYDVKVARYYFFALSSLTQTLVKIYSTGRIHEGSARYDHLKEITAELYELFQFPSTEESRVIFKSLENSYTNQVDPLMKTHALTGRIWESILARWVLAQAIVPEVETDWNKDWKEELLAEEALVEENTDYDSATPMLEPRSAPRPKKQRVHSGFENKIFNQMKSGFVQTIHDSVHAHAPTEYYENWGYSDVDHIEKLIGSHSTYLQVRLRFAYVDLTASQVKTLIMEDFLP